MHVIVKLLWVRLWKDRRGQDLIEYALLVAFVSVLVAAIMPGVVSNNISAILSKVSSSMTQAAAQS